MKNNKMILYAFIALLFCGAIVCDSDIIDNTETQTEEHYKNYEMNSLYSHGNTVYYDIDINKMPIDLS